MIKKITTISLVTALLSLLSMNTLTGQVSLTNAAASALIDFSNTTPSSVGTTPATAYAAAGFSANPTTAGRLNSNAWALTGWSDGAVTFGGSNVTGDYIRGATSVSVTTGGMYAYTGAPGSAANPAFMFQPGGSDFAPGTLTLRVVNNGTTAINSFTISYDLYVRNDQARSSSFNFSYSLDNSSYTAVSALDYTSGAALDALGWVKVGTSPSRSTVINSLNIAPGGFFYIRWSSNDVAGSGSRDELGLDDISINAAFVVNPSFNVTNNGLQPTAASILQGSNKNMLQRFVLRETNVAAGTLNTITIPLTGTYMASDINAAGLKLYTAPTNNYASATVLSAQASLASGSGESVSFSSLNYAVAQNSTQYFWITADVSASGTVGNTIRATALNAGNFTFAAGTVTASVNQGGIQTISAPTPSLNVTDNGTQPASASVLQNTTNNLLQSFVVTEGNVAAATLNVVAIPLAGTYSASDINGAGLKLYASTTNSFTSATVLSASVSTSSGSGETALFNGLNYAIAKNSTHYFWVTADIANSATVGNTINASALSASNFSFTSAAPTVSVNVGGVQTIDAAPVLTQLRTSYCGYTAQSFGEFIGADSVLGAHHYRFQLVNSATSFTQTFTNSSGYPYLTLYTIPGISYNTTYTVTVAWSADNVTWSNYGSPCTITSPMNEVTELQPAYCGFTASSYSQIIYANRVSGATQYEYKLVNAAQSYTQTFVKTNNNFNLSQFTGLQPGTTYSVSLRVFIFGAWDIYGSSCNVTTPSGVTTTSLQSTSCGVTVSSYPQILYAVPVVNATQYEYRVMNAALSYTQTFVKTNNNFNLGQFTGLTNGTTYSVAVRANVGGVWGNFANNCQVTTPSTVPTTSLQPASCGITASSYAQVLYAVALTGATQYEYRLENAAASYTQSFVKTNNNFNLTQFTGLTNGTTYSVSVRANVGGSWGNFGPVCTVATPASSPTTSLQPASCGITLSSYTQILYAVAVTGATQYEYKLENTSLGYSQSFVKTNNNFNFGQFTGLANSTAYDVQVRVFFNGGWGSYGSICTITTPASALMLNGNTGMASREGIENADPTLAENSFNALAYPNPFNKEFSLTLLSYTVNEPVHIRVYDATGKLVEQHDVSAETVKELTIGAGYAEGLYNIMVSQGTQHKSIKVIRQ